MNLSVAMTLSTAQLIAVDDEDTLYRSAGFVEITPYAANSMRAYQPAETEDTYRASAVFMELQLAPDSPL